jgi:CHRD domain/PEP-CTERM motif
VDKNLQTNSNNRIHLMKRILFAMLMASSLVSTQAAVTQYSITFAPEAVGATGTGNGTATYDSVAHTLQLMAVYSGLSGNVSQTHIHGPTANPGLGTSGIMVGNTTLPNFTLGATSGNYSQTLDLTQSGIYNAGFLAGAGGGTAAGAETAFVNAANQGRAYWNIHTSAFPGGEIRGFLTVVPEPSSVALTGLAIAGLALRVWQKRRAGRP